MVLESLGSESVKHVDKFATFLSTPLLPMTIETHRWLPNRCVKIIDMTGMKELQGELHCRSLHLPAFAAVTGNIYPLKNAVREYFPEDGFAKEADTRLYDTKPQIKPAPYR